MAEWFKATDLRPVIYDAWVRTPLLAKEACFDNKEACFDNKEACFDNTKK